MEFIKAGYTIVQFEGKQDRWVEFIGYKVNEKRTEHDGTTLGLA